MDSKDSKQQIWNPPVTQKPQTAIKVGDDLAMSEDAYLSGQTTLLIVALFIIAIFYLSIRSRGKRKQERLKK